MSLHRNGQWSATITFHKDFTLCLIEAQAEAELLNAIAERAKTKKDIQNAVENVEWLYIPIKSIHPKPGNWRISISEADAPLE